jgi:hypothetical protein
MIACCARVGANAPNGGDVGSLAAAMPGGSVDVVKKVLAEKLEEAAPCIAGFAGCSNATSAAPRVVPQSLTQKSME